MNLIEVERQRDGIYDIDTETVSTITSHKPDYSDRDLEQLVGLQTDEALKRTIMPFGGIRLVRASCLQASLRTEARYKGQAHKILAPVGGINLNFILLRKLSCA